MKWGAALRLMGVFVLLVTLHYTVRPLLGWRAGMDFLVIAVLLTAVRVRPGMAALIGFATGVIADSLTPTSFGAGALALTLVGFAASRLKAVFFADNVLLHALFFFAGKWAHDLVYLIADRQLGVTSFLAQLLIWSPISAMATAVAGIAILLAFRLPLGAQRA